MAYGLPNSDFDFPYDSQKHELEIEKQLLQRRIREINFELDDLRDAAPQRRDRDCEWMDEPCAPIESTGFEQFMQSALVIGLTIGAIVVFLL